MIKILRKGRDREFKQDCLSCNSLFSFELKDLQEEKYGTQGDCNFIRYFIYCPVCNKKIIYRKNPFFQTDPIRGALCLNTDNMEEVIKI